MRLGIVKGLVGGGRVGRTVGSGAYGEGDLDVGGG